MDLQDVINVVLGKGPQAHLALNEGHEVLAQRLLNEVSETITGYFDEKGKTEADVTELPTSETSQEKTQETPAQVPGSPAQPAAGAGPP